MRSNTGLDFWGYALALVQINCHAETQCISGLLSPSFWVLL